MTYAVETIFTLFLTPNTSLLEFNRLFKSYANLNEKTNCITIELLEFFIDLEFESSSHTCTVTIFTPLVFWVGFLSTSFLFNCTPSLPYHAAHPQWVLSLMQPPYSPEYPPPVFPWGGLVTPGNTHDGVTGPKKHLWPWSWALPWYLLALPTRDLTKPYTSTSFVVVEILTSFSLYPMTYFQIEGLPFWRFYDDLLFFNNYSASLVTNAKSEHTAAFL